MAYSVEFRERPNYDSLGKLFRLLSILLSHSTHESLPGSYSRETAQDAARSHATILSGGKIRYGVVKETQARS